MHNPTIPSELLSIVRNQDNKNISQPIRVLCEELHSLHQNSIQAILFYGSCLRSESDLDGIVDLYLIVDRYRSFYNSWLPALMNKLLPPNVFYIEVPLKDRKVRAKYAVLSLEDFQRSTSMRWFHSYFWARFAQPTKTVHVLSSQIQETIDKSLAQAVMTFITRTLPQTPPSFNSRTLWETGLSLTYRAELRTERPGRITQLIEANRDYYQQTADAALPHISTPITVDRSVQPIRYRTQHSSSIQFVNKVAWFIRRAQGKVLSVLRLIKGLFTFHGGVDYILWKIERHSGVSIELTPSQRKHPLLASPGVLWKLYRKGAFR